MDKDSLILFQKIDCNCNDCKFMNREFDKYKKSQELHHKWQLDHFNGAKKRVIAKANEWKEKDEIQKYENLMNEANKMNFIFDKSTTIINYGNCTKLNKEVNFVPNVCQLDTQDCFEHRRTYKN